MAERRHRTVDTEPHLPSDLRLQSGERETRATVEAASGCRRSRCWGRCALRLWTWAAIVPALLTPLAPWFWLGDLGANLGRYLIIALLPGLIVFGRQAVAGLILCCALVAVSWPWMRQAWEQRAPAPSAEGGDTLRILVANGAWWNREPPAVVAAALLAVEADILVLSEAREDLVAELHRSGFWRRWHRRAVDDAQGPYSIAVASRVGWGDGQSVLRIAGPPREDAIFEKAGIETLHKVTVPVITFERNGRSFLLVALHPPPPTSLSLWRHQRAVYRAVLERVEKESQPVILAGDWNATSGAAVWRAAYQAGFRRAQGAEAVTWSPVTPPWLRPVLGLPLDRVAVRGAALGAVETVIIPGSDHRGVVATVQLP